MASEASVKWQGEGLFFEGEVAGGGTVKLASGGDTSGSGPSPMQAVLLALAACTGMDVVSILAKMRQPLRGLRVEVTAERRDEHPRVFTAIELVFRLEGDLDDAKVSRAIELSETKYCSVEAMLRPGVAIVSRYEIER
jgi:putative redox protein